MIDFHSHIIPGIDDGAENIEISLAMLNQSMKDGVTEIVSTSHCYPRYTKSIEHFIQRRTAGFDELFEAVKNNVNIPKIHLASEVNLITDISEFDNLDKLCLPNGKYIMIEMPYGIWKEWMIDSVYKMTINGFKPIMAHIDRFVGCNTSLLNSLFELDVIYQVNAEVFLKNTYNKVADNLLGNGHAHLLGSDMHNTTTRPTTLKSACEKIEKRYGRECVDYFNENAEKVLNGGEARTEIFEVKKKPSIFERMFKK